MLEFKNIYKSFNKNTEVQLDLYQDLNLKVNKDEFVVIIGSNGSGKSTLFNVLSDQESIDSGSIIFDKKDITKMSSHKIFRNISRVYQDPLAGTSYNLSILENLSMAYDKGNLMSFKKGMRSDKKQHFIELLKQLDLGLEDKLDVLVKNLSGGQRQALSLLMAVMNNPKMLLLDEHTAALDPKSSEIIMKLTKQMVSDRKITTLMVTHNLAHALAYGDRLLMFHKGKIIYDVSNEEKAKLSRADLVNLFVQYDQVYIDEI